jgi:hypothetical protein
MAAGTGLLCAFFYSDKALTGSLLFLWLLLVDAQPMSQDVFRRLLLALLCLLSACNFSPLLGHKSLAALMPITAAAVLLADGTNCISDLQNAAPARLGSLPGNRDLAGHLLFLFVGETQYCTISYGRCAARQSPRNTLVAAVGGGSPDGPRRRTETKLPGGTAGSWPI